MMYQVQESDLCGDYADPVRRLLLVGDPAGYDPSKWPDYRGQFGIGPEHVDALIRMASDARLNGSHPDSSAVWAPLHAWRALGQLRAEASIVPLLAILREMEDDDSVDLELPVVFGMIGPAAIPHIAEFMADQSNPEWSVSTAPGALREIATRHPECRDECIAILAGMLEPHRDADSPISGFVVAALLDLQAVEAIDTIRAAFRRDSVDISIAGDIEDVEIDLRLRDRRATPTPRYTLLPPVRSPEPVANRVVQRDISAVPRREKIGRNQPCPCGSGKKYKKCCL